MVFFISTEVGGEIFLKSAHFGLILNLKKCVPGKEKIFDNIRV